VMVRKQVHSLPHHALTGCSPTFSHLSQLSLKLWNIDLTCNALNRKSNI